MFQFWKIALEQIKAGNTCESLLNQIRKIIYSSIKQNKLLKKYMII